MLTDHHIAEALSRAYVCAIAAPQVNPEPKPAITIWATIDRIPILL